MRRQHDAEKYELSDAEKARLDAQRKAASTSIAVGGWLLSFVACGDRNRAAFN